MPLALCNQVGGRSYLIIPKSELKAVRATRLFRMSQPSLGPPPGTSSGVCVNARGRSVAARLKRSPLVVTLSRLNSRYINHHQSVVCLVSRPCARPRRRLARRRGRVRGWRGVAAA